MSHLLMNWCSYYYTYINKWNAKELKLKQLPMYVLCRHCDIMIVNELPRLILFSIVHSTGAGESGKSTIVKQMKWVYVCFVL